MNFTFIHHFYQTLIKNSTPLELNFFNVMDYFMSYLNFFINLVKIDLFLGLILFLGFKEVSFEFVSWLLRGWKFVLFRLRKGNHLCFGILLQFRKFYFWDRGSWHCDFIFCGGLFIMFLNFWIMMATLSDSTSSNSYYISLS